MSGLDEGRVWIAVDTLSQKMDALGSQISDIRDRITRIESADHQKVVDALESKIHDLEEKVEALTADKYARGGALQLGEWLYRSMPWIIATAVAVTAYWQAHPAP